MDLHFYRELEHSILLLEDYRLRIERLCISLTMELSGTKSKIGKEDWIQVSLKQVSNNHVQKSPREAQLLGLTLELVCNAR